MPTRRWSASVSRSAAFAELGRFGEGYGYAVQLRADHQEPWGWMETLALGGSWQPAPGFRLRAHAGESFRAPSFSRIS